MTDITVAVKEIVEEINHAALSRSERGLNILRNSAIRVLSQDGTGRRYGRHIASAPGSPPAPDKGNLRRNWSQQRLVSRFSRTLRIRLRLKSRMKYQPYLEFGTRRMSPRPHVERIKTLAKPKILALYSNL